MYPRVKGELCERCGTCIEICPLEVYQMGRKAAEIAFPNECIECGACVQQCPAECVVLIDG
jgi:NAD-dependent dihydropyrimidine dehydrogenase PreA subunit